MRYLILLLFLCAFSPAGSPVKSPVSSAVISDASAVDSGPTDWLDSAQRDELYALDHSSYADGVTDIKFTSTGDNFYIVNNHPTNQGVLYLSASIAYDPYTSPSSFGQQLDTTGCGTDPNTISWNDADDELTITDNANIVCVYENVSSDYINGGTIKETVNTFPSGGGFEISELRDLEYVDDGNEAHLLDVDGEVIVYDLASPYTITGLSINTTKSGDYSDVVPTAKGFNYRNEGLEIVLVDSTDAEVDRCTLTTAYDPSSRSSCSTFSLSAVSGITPFGVWVEDTQELMYIADVANDIIEVFAGTISTGSRITAWTQQTGAGYNIGTNTFKRIERLNDTDLVVNHNGTLSTIRNTDSTWSDVGNDASAGSQQNRMCYLATNKVALPDAVSSALEVWEWDGTDWTLESSTEVDSFSVYDNCAYLEDNEIAVIKGGSNLIKYSYDGSTAFTSSNTLAISGGTYKTITGMTTSRIAMLDTGSNPDSVKAFDFDGTDWSQTGNSFSLPYNNAGARGIAKIDSDTVVAITSNATYVQALDFDGTDFTNNGVVGVLAELGGSWPKDIVQMNDNEWAISCWASDEIRLVSNDGITQ